MTTKVNMKTVLLDLDDTPLKRPDIKAGMDSNGEPITRDFILADACMDACNATFKGEEPSFEEKFDRFKLALKISEMNGEDHMELDPEDCTKLMKLIGKGFPPIIVGRAAVLLGKSIK